MQSLSLVNVIFIMLLRDQLQYKYQYITFTSHRETFQRILSRILESGEEAEKLVYMKLPDSYIQSQSVSSVSCLGWLDALDCLQTT